MDANPAIVLPDLDETAPAGPDLEFDAAFGELERAARGKPEQQYGGTIIPAEAPNWKEVAAAATELAERTRDLRVLTRLAVARLHLKGFSDYAEVIGMIRYLLEQRWAFVHPQLDPEEPNDTTQRCSVLVGLQEPIWVMRQLRDLPLAASPRDGAVSWRTIGLSTGAIETDNPLERKTEAVIRAAFIATGMEALTARHAMMTQCLADITGIGAAFDTNAGYGQGPDLSPLSKLLQEMARYITLYMPAGGETASEDEAAPETAGGAEAGGAPAQTRTGATASSLTSVSTRADALRLLDLVCRYYEQNEPSSPLPLLIGRARKLGEMGFMEIMQELAPDGVPQAQMIVQSRNAE